MARVSCATAEDSGSDSMLLSPGTVKTLISAPVRSGTVIVELGQRSGQRAGTPPGRWADAEAIHTLETTVG